MREKRRARHSISISQPLNMLTKFCLQASASINVAFLFNNEIIKMFLKTRERKNKLRKIVFY